MFRITQLVPFCLPGSLDSLIRITNRVHVSKMLMHGVLILSPRKIQIALQFDLQVVNKKVKLVHMHFEKRSNIIF